MELKQMFKYILHIDLLINILTVCIALASFSLEKGL